MVIYKSLCVLNDNQFVEVFMKPPSLSRLAAFTQSVSGGNPAGVWVGEELPSAEIMQRIAAEVGYSETAFVAPSSGYQRVVRYYSPEAEVPFCGHATIATGVALGRDSGAGTYRLSTKVGEVPLSVSIRDGVFVASLTSVPPKQASADAGLIKEVLAVIGWSLEELDSLIPPVKAYAGAWHLVLAAGTKDRLARLQYDFEKLKKIMLREDLTTLQLVWRESSNVFHSRNPFPVGGVIEDPATGAAAAALGGYLRSNRAVPVPSEITILQGQDMGRPSQIHVEIPEAGGIVVSGEAVWIAK